MTKYILTIAYAMTSESVVNVTAVCAKPLTTKQAMNSKFCAAADWVIEMGPRGRSEGGRVIFTGVPEELIQAKDTLTGQYMKINL